MNNPCFQYALADLVIDERKNRESSAPSLLVEEKVAAVECAVAREELREAGLGSARVDVGNE